MTERETVNNAGDDSEQLLAQIEQARANDSGLYICGGGSKRHILGRECQASELNLASHIGIVNYEPGELVITARGGTPLTDIAATLAKENQVLSFEPPLLRGKATLGGTLACNLSGPARPWAGAFRDMVLGVQLLSAKAQRLNFGGRVMKNVAGYDISRLQAGALGTLGVISEVSFRVSPRDECQRTLCYEMPAQQALDTMNRRAGEAAPLSGACWLDGQLYLRLSGAASAVQHKAALWGGDTQTGDDHFWQHLREQTLPFFTGDSPLWRLSLGSTTPVDLTTDTPLIDWCGARRWYRSEQLPDTLAQSTSTSGGHAILYRGGDRQAEVRSPPGPVEQRLQLRLKQSFDPEGIFNPGRLYSWL